MSPEDVMRMPFKRFTAWQRYLFRRSVDDKNRELERQRLEES